MSISISVGAASFPIGTADFLNCFFSTVFVRLEQERRGTRFPEVMHGLCGGTLSPDRARAALRELAVIRDELSRLPPGDVIWDSDDRTRQPPWGTAIAASVTSLGNYFWTDDGKPLLDVLEAVFSASETTGAALEIR